MNMKEYNYYLELSCSAKYCQPLGFLARHKLKSAKLTIYWWPCAVPAEFIQILAQAKFCDFYSEKMVSLT
jgi:hypothetical protein